MAHAHRTDQCRVCNKVLRTCRCIGPKDIWWTTCSVCLAKSATPQPKTIRLRIAVAVDSDGNWECEGSSSGVYGVDDEIARRALSYLDVTDKPVVVRFIEATVPLPESVTVEGEVKL